MSLTKLLDSDQVAAMRDDARSRRMVFVGAVRSRTPDIAEWAAMMRREFDGALLERVVFPNGEELVP